MSESLTLYLFYKSDNLYPINLSKGETINKKEWSLSFQDEGVYFNGKLMDYEENELEDALLSVYHTKRSTSYYIPSQEYIICHEQNQSSLLQLQANIRYCSGKLIVDPKKTKIYYNLRLIKEISLLPFKNGDQLYCDGILIEVRYNSWRITQYDDKVINDQELLHCRPTINEREFRRSPRIIEGLPQSTFIIDNEPNFKKLGEQSLLKTLLPSLATVISALMIIVMQPHNRFLNSSMVLVAIITICSTAIYHNKEKKQHTIEEQEVLISYQTYLNNIISKIQTQYLEEKRILKATFPSMNELMQLVNVRKSRLYEKLPDHDDFLTISVGLGGVSSGLTIKHQLSEQSEIEKRILNILSDVSMHQNVPIPISLRHSFLGLIGSHSKTSMLLEAILLQLVFYHSYQELRLFLFCNRKNYQKTWSQWRRLRHFQLSDRNISTIVHDMSNQDTIMNYLYHVITERLSMDVKKSKENWPWLLIAIEEDYYFKGHALMELLLKDLTPYHISIVLCKEKKEQLSEVFSTIVEVLSVDSAQLISTSGQLKRMNLKPYALTEEKFELIRNLAQINHVEHQYLSFPKKVSFFECFQIKQISDWDLLGIWEKSQSQETLQVPIGQRATGEVITLDLHEKADGPHGLIAGTTGSGKSEFLQTLILSLALNYSPEDVGFLLIDFKGGGMANLFKKLPHLIGTITNLDGRGVNRALLSIRAELQKRQKLFKQFQVNHIDDYKQCFKENPSNEMPALPHLILISDEFAELKVNCPEFMKELVSISRIGRSLGIHLILATQKPTGIVDEQIWSNSRFHIALKVASVHDSKDILRTEDAAHIKDKGRAYLQVGNNETYEQFQTAWSGALTNNQINSHQNSQIWKINDLCQKELIFGTATLSKTSEINQRTQLEESVDFIDQQIKNYQGILPDRPWLEELEKLIILPDQQLRWTGNWETAFPLGVIDLPEEQCQTIFYFDLRQAGHTLFVGVGQSGKTTVLELILLAFARFNSPEELQFHIFNFGNSHLPLFKTLWHVDDVISVDESIKIRKMIHRIHREINKRKKLFKDENVSSYREYLNQTGTKLPIIVTMIDHFDSIKDSPLIEELETMLLELLRDGASLGCYVIVTALRLGSIRLSIRGYFTSYFALYMNDRSELRELVGREAVEQIFIPGRLQTSLSPSHEIQVFLPFNIKKLDDDFSILVRESIQKIMQSTSYKGHVPKPIPLLPEQFELKDLPLLKEGTKLCLGLDDEFVEPVVLEFTQFPYLVCLTDNPVQEDSLLDLLWTQLALSNSRNKTFECLDCDSRIENTEVYLGKIYQDNLNEVVKNLITHTKEKLYSGECSIEYYLFLDCHNLFSQINIDIKEFEWLLRNAYKCHKILIFQGSINQIERSFNDYAKLLRKHIPAALIGTRLVDQQIIKAKTTLREPYLDDDEMYLVEKNQMTKFKLPRSSR